LLSGANIICFSSIDWDFNRQNPQEVALAFAESGNRVLFIENSGVRRPAMRDTSRLRTRFVNWCRAGGGVRSLGNGVDLHSPLLIPLPYSRFAGFINARVLLPIIRRWLSRDAGRPLVIITFLPTALAVSMIRGLDRSAVVYYCIDRIAESSPGASRLRESEPQLIAEADLVFLTAEDVRTEAMKAARRIEKLPSGVRFHDFDRTRRAAAKPPEVFDGLTGPVVGFAGTLRKHTDLDLLAQVAALAPDLNFVFVGPQMTNVRGLNAQPNVHLVEAMPHDEMMRYVVRFDAGVLPYVLDDFTAGIMPAKLKEYLAAGLPVVSTPLPEVLRFADEHPGLIEFASNAPGFVAALRTSLAANSAAVVEQRREVAKLYDWPVIMARMSDLIETVLNGK
jgi:glycosyltransferase involved in cell wall biosynthesis